MQSHLHVMSYTLKKRVLTRPKSNRKSMTLATRICTHILVEYEPTLSLLNDQHKETSIRRTQPLVSGPNVKVKFLFQLKIKFQIREENQKGVKSKSPQSLMICGAMLLICRVSSGRQSTQPSIWKF